ncbi:MAG: A24 family peptidase [Acidiferrobacterales bacterium]
MFDATLYFLESHPTFFIFSIALYGLAVGSFLNVVIFRLPVMLDQIWRERAQLTLELEPDDNTGSIGLVSPRSRCPHCDHPITAWENIPVVSYLILRGKCSECKKKISVRYPLVELATAALSVSVAWSFGVTTTTLAGLLFIWALIPLALIDYDHQILPDVITLPFLWLGLLVNAFSIFADLQSAVIGAIAGYLSLWLVYQAFKLLTKKEGMGFGDFKLLAMLGAWLGWQLLPLTILLAAFSGAVIGGTYLVLSRHGRDHPIPFGPFLCVAGWIALLWGHDLVRAYLQFARLA